MNTKKPIHRYLVEEEIWLVGPAGTFTLVSPCYQMTKLPRSDGKYLLDEGRSRRPTRDFPFLRSARRRKDPPFRVSQRGEVQKEAEPGVYLLPKQISP